MKLILGQSLDGQVYRPMAENSATAGILYCGPMKFIGVLETHFGLPYKLKSGIIRSLYYEGIIRKTGNGKQFYSDSFTLDPRGTAAKLLVLRDEILLGAKSGFEITGLLKASSRFIAISELEQNSNRLPPGIPDFLREIIRELRKKRISQPVKNLFLTDPAEMWPVLWQELFSELESQGCKISPFVAPTVTSKGDLLHSKQALLAKSNNMVKAEGDGSLVLIEANNPVEAADIAAVCVKLLCKKDESIVLVSGEDSEVLQGGFFRMDMPSPGGKQRTYGLDTMQILPLRLLLSWRPVDPRVLQQYLSLSVSPIPFKLRKSLIEIISRTGSVGGVTWEKIIAEHIDKTDKGKRDVLKETINNWLHIGYLGPVEKIPLKEINEICGIFREWARKRGFASNTIDPGFFMSMEQSDIVSEACAIISSVSIEKPYLRKLLRDITETMPCIYDFSREHGGVFSVASAGAVLAPVDTMVWWNAGEKSLEALPERFWTNSEKKELEKAGVTLPEASTDLVLHHTEWARGISATCKRLVFILSRLHGDEGEPDEVHPVWHELTSLFENDTNAKITVHSNDLMAGDGDDFFTKMIVSHFKKAGVAGFPEYRKEWNLAPSLLKERDKHSSSSFLKMAGCSFSYVCNYLANIRSTDILAVSKDSQLYGNVAHDVIERFLEACDGWPEQKKIKMIASEIFDNYLQKDGAVLNLPGKEKERLDIKNKIILACEQLVMILRSGEWEFDGIEKELEKSTDLGPVTGFCDLIVKKKKNPAEKAVIDLKWSGRSIRVKELTEGKAVQLAVYSSLLGKSWPHTAFFIINKAEMLTVHKDTFPGATVVDGPDEQETWEKIKTVISSRKKAFSSGLAAIGVPKDSGDEPDFIFAPCYFCEVGLFCRSSEAV